MVRIRINHFESQCLRLMFESKQRCTSKLTNTMSSTKLTRRSKRDKRPSSASAATGDGAPNAIPIARRSTMHVYLSGFEHKEKANLTRVSVAWTFLSLR